MKYEKPPLTFEQQADLLISRGLIADRDVLISRLRAVNYYRLSGYLYTFRESDTVFKAGTTLDKVWHHYIFDRQLRMIVMDGIERVEVAVRTQLAYLFAHSCGPFAYSNPANLPGLWPEAHARWLDDLKQETDRSTETFIKHFQEQYGDSHSMLPLWMLVEVMSFGKTLTFYKGVHRDMRRDVAAQYGVPDTVLYSWLTSLNAIRNICAHHGRLWNRVLGYKPKLPNQRKYPEWYEPVVIPQERVFVILTILRYLLKLVAPTTRWEERLRSLLANNSDISRSAMGFPDNWNESSLWK
jgi:abortive infection bacteriophage resistance protein